jgi:pyruvate kinase
MTLPPNKTKIVCTIGPASESPEVMEQMIRAGLNVARLNFSHGDFESHGRVIERLRAGARSVGRRVTVMADLPGPKIRIGQLAGEPIELGAGDAFDLTTEDIVGDARRASVSFAPLPQVVRTGNTLYLNDGVIQLEVRRVQGSCVECRVVVGGELRSRKGLNLPGIDLGISAFTERDQEWLRFAAGAGVDAISQSFVESGADVMAVRQAAAALDYHPFLIAKIERSRALDHMDSILEAADGIMIARGDLGVEIPIERIAVVQKRLMREANLLGKPVITATQMLESMTTNRRPTRAEATDVANAILDGTDCVMLSGESAMGRYPVEAVAMLAKIAVAVEPFRPGHRLRETLMSMVQRQTVSPGDLIAISVESALERMSPAAVIIPTRTGTTARHIARFRMPVWITAVSTQEAICQGLQFSYGVYPVHAPEDPDDWKAFAREWLRTHEVPGHLVILTQGPSSKHPDDNFRMEIMDLDRVTRERTSE